MKYMLNVGDKIIEYLYSAPRRAYTVSRVTKTMAVAIAGGVELRLRREVVGGHCTKIPYDSMGSLKYSLASPAEMNNLQRQLVIEDIQRLAREFSAHGKSVEELEELRELLRGFQKIV